MEDSLPGCLGRQASSLSILLSCRHGRLEARRPRQARCLSSERSRPSIPIKPRSLLCMLSEKRAWYILLVSSRKFLHFFNQFFYAKALREAQWPATPGRKTGAKNHSVIGILRRSDHILFQTTRRFVDHLKHQAIRNVIATGAKRSGG